MAYLRDESITAEQVMAEETIRWTITTPLYNIGEQIYNLPDDFKQRHGQIPWAKISGLRHRLVHDYDNTNWSLICAVLFDELPGFLEELRTL